MTLLIGRGLKEILIPNGYYSAATEEGFQEMKQVLYGHPSGIHELVIARQSSQIVVARRNQSPVNRPRKIDNPVKVSRINEGVGRVEIVMGQTYEESLSCLLQIILYSGAAIMLETQGVTMQMTHVAE